MRLVDDLYIQLEYFDVLKLQRSGVLKELSEGKSIGSQKFVDLQRQMAIDQGYDFNKRKFRSGRRSMTSSTKRSLVRVKDFLLKEMLNIADNYFEGKVGYRRFERQMRDSLKAGYLESYLLGIQGSGPKGTRPRRFGELSTVDQKSISSSIREEMMHFTKLLSTFKKRSRRGDQFKRVAKYVEALDAQYASARIVGTPSNHLISWISPMDKTTCEGCSYLHKHGPYSTNTLPSTPKAGLTPCLVNCRCRLVTTPVAEARIGRTARSQPLTKSMRALKRILRKHGLGR